MALYLYRLAMLYGVFLFIDERVAYRNDVGVFRFSNIYSDHMVLQMKPHQAVVWGFGEQRQEVTLAFNGKDYHTQVTTGRSFP